MTTEGTNSQDLKISNRILILKLIATHAGLTRVQLASITSLSKMSISNIVSDLIEMGYIAEHKNPATSSASGRKPVFLKLSAHSPCICGMLIERDFIKITLGDIGGNMIIEPVCIDLENSGLTDQKLIQYLSDAFRQVKNSVSRPILAIGISSIGPLDIKKGLILHPPFFHNIESLPIVEQIQRVTGLPTFLMNESNAGALAECLYGQAADLSNFLYLHITNGIGAGVVLNRKLFEGEFGQNGGLGHVSINFAGPKCECGNVGCLELYANRKQLRNKVRELSYLYPDSVLSSAPSPSWVTVLDAAHTGDPLAILALEEFCGYIAQAICSVLNILDLSTIVLDYPFSVPGTVIDTLLERKLANLRPKPFYREVSIRKSSFIGDASLIGSIAIVADKIFQLELSLF